MHFHIYIHSDLSIHELADQFRDITNCNTSNRSKGQVDQRRDGVNRGGLYYLFELVGLEICLMENEGEVYDETFGEYEYYAMVTQLNDNIDLELFKSCVCYLGSLLRYSGVDNKIIEM